MNRQPSQHPRMQQPDRMALERVHHGIDSTVSGRCVSEGRFVFLLGEEGGDEFVEEGDGGLGCCGDGGSPEGGEGFKEGMGGVL